MLCAFHSSVTGSAWGATAAGVEAVEEAMPALRGEIGSGTATTMGEDHKHDHNHIFLSRHEEVRV